MTTAAEQTLHPTPGPAEPGAREYFSTPKGKLSLWVGVLGAPVVWAVQFQAGYALGPFTHAHRWLTVVHHVISVLALAGAVACGVVAWRDWRRMGGGEPESAEGGVSGRSRFMAALGILTTILFTLVILAQWLVVFFIDPGWY